MTAVELLRAMVELLMRGDEAAATALLEGAPGTGHEHAMLLDAVAPSVYGEYLARFDFDRAAIVVGLAVGARVVMLEAEA